jgi:conjugative transfer signal peptidase TraF
MKRLLFCFSGVVLLVGGFLWVFYHLGYRMITTSSVPVGLWKVKPVQQSVQRGQFVWFCPPDTSVFRLARQRGYIPEGDCSGGYRHLLKPVVAITGDRVTVGLKGIAVNGLTLLNSTQLSRDGAGRMIPKMTEGDVVVEKNTVWVISVYHQKSFDSRYFGAIPFQKIEGVAIPVWVKG